MKVLPVLGTAWHHLMFLHTLSCELLKPGYLSLFAMMSTMNERTPPRQHPSTPNSSRRKYSQAKIFLVLGFAMGVAFTAIVSSIFSSSFVDKKSPIELSIEQPPCNCRKKEDMKSEETTSKATVDQVNSQTVLLKKSTKLSGVQQSTTKKSSSQKVMEQPVVDPRKHLILDNRSSDIPDFDPSAPVVIVTKIQGMNTVGALNQSLCLLSYAYNHRVNYDIVVFSATMIMEKQLNLIRSTVYPANLTFIIDNPGLQEMVDALDEDRKNALLKRCNVTNSSQLTWSTRCVETSSSGTTTMPIQYCWQAQFRSLHLWNHPALAKYKYMLWMDTDGFCSKVWKEDPIAIMRRNNMVFLFDNYPKGAAKGKEWPYIFQEAFGETYCSVSRTKAGHLSATPGRCLGRSVQLLQVHGFFHFTDLDFYRSEPVMKWLRAMVGNTTFSRKYDDQIAVTIPAAVLAGNRSWDLRSIGVNLSVVHDFVLDGRLNERVGGFIDFWKASGSTVFPEAYGKCNAVSPG